MLKAPIPENENERLKTLKDYKILDTLQEEHFDEVTKTAALVCECEISLISLVDTDRQWFKSKMGLDVSETPREISFCGHAILSDELLVVEDTTKDHRFFDNPLCLGAPNIKFYAGAPLIAPNGQRIGTLCVIDSTPKILSPEKRAVLKQLSKQLIGYLELKKISNELKSRENKLTQWFIQSQDAIMTLEPPDWLFTSGNPATLKLFKVNTEEEFLKLGPSKLSPEKQPDGDFSANKAKQMIETAMEKGSHFFEWSHLAADGSVIPCTVLLSRIQENDKVYMQAIVRDISQKILAEQELAQQKTIAQHHAKLASIGQLAAGVGHEINNPLAIIAGYLTAIELKYIKEQGEVPEFLNIYLKKINFAVERITRIIRGLRSFSRIDAQEKSAFSPFEATQESIYMIDEIYKKDGIQLIFDGQSSQSVFVFGSRGNFQQMLMNLLSNAKDALSDSRQKNIEIVLKEKTDNLEIVVKDTGCGIPSELHDKVFEMFFTTKEVNKGTGIGLAQVDNFVKEMGGSLRVDSGVGRGTSIIIELPIIKNKAD